MKIYKLISLFAIGVFLISSCGPGYNTDYPTPNSKSDPKDVFPKKIGELTPKFSAVKELDKKEYGGVMATYGEGEIVLEGIMAFTEGGADKYVNDKVAPRIDAYNSNGRARINGKWSGHGKKSSGEKIYAWQNGQWVFIISAKNEALFDSAIENFDLISKEK